MEVAVRKPSYVGLLALEKRQQISAPYVFRTIRHGATI
jgi:hypothetical protein